MSKLRRDRHALRVARYVKKTDCPQYAGSGRWGMASYRAMAWLMSRKVHATFDDVRSEHQAMNVYWLFGVYDW